MKKNGFTLIELLAMLAVLGILMLITIPNISGMLKNQKLDRVKNAATSMVETAKIKASREKYLEKPKSGECIVFSLSYLNDNANIEKGPNGGVYSEYDSLVVYTREGSKYKYYVRLVEEFDSKRVGISILDSNLIKKLKFSNIVEVSDNLGLVKNDNNATGLNKLNASSTISSKCPSGVKAYYTNKIYCDIYDGKYYDNHGNEVDAARYAEVCH